MKDDINQANELDLIAKKYATDKCSERVGSNFAKGYTRYYSRYLSKLRFEKIKLLEIGVADGASLKMWEEYLPQAKIYGIDINQETKKFETERIKIFIGDQKDLAFLHSVVQQIGAPLDVIIDDGGHKMSQHKASLEALFPHIAPGGIYAIEDLHTAYFSSFEGGYLEPRNTIEYLKRLVDTINRADDYFAQTSVFQRRKVRFLGKLPQRLPDSLKGLESIHFYELIAFLLKSK